MERVHQLRDADQQHDRREHLAHDDETEEQTAPFELHARHRIRRRNAAEHRNCRRTGREDDGVEQEAQHAAVADILEVAPYPLGRQHVQEVHVRRFRVAAERRDKHDIERIEDEYAEDEDEQIQPAAGKRLLQLAIAQVRNAAQQRQNRRKRDPKHRTDVHIQTAEQSQNIVPRRAVIEEIIHLSEQRVVLNMPADKQIDPPRERIGDRPRELRNHQQRDKRQNARKQIEAAGHRADRRARHIQRLAARSKQQNQRNRQIQRHHAHGIRHADARHALSMTKAGEHQRPARTLEALSNGKGDHRGRHAF